jgi:hypothetical protein
MNLKEKKANGEFGDQLSIPALLEVRRSSQHILK